MASSASKTPTGKKAAAKTSASKPATGKAPFRKARQFSPRDTVGQFKSRFGQIRPLAVSRNQAAAAVAITAVGIGAGVLLNWLWRSESDDYYSPAAFADGETMDRDNFDQTRSAGPDAMRDEDGDDWDKVDQALDESFPASDPPSTY